MRTTPLRCNVPEGCFFSSFNKFLNHSDNRAIGAYDWHTYDHEKRDALELRGKHLERALTREVVQQGHVK